MTGFVANQARASTRVGTTPSQKAPSLRKMPCRESVDVQVEVEDADVGGHTTKSEIGVRSPWRWITTAFRRVIVSVGKRSHPEAGYGSRAAVEEAEAAAAKVGGVSEAEASANAGEQGFAQAVAIVVVAAATTRR